MTSITCKQLKRDYTTLKADLIEINQLLATGKNHSDIAEIKDKQKQLLDAIETLAEDVFVFKAHEQVTAMLLGDTRLQSGRVKTREKATTWIEKNVDLDMAQKLVKIENLYYETVQITKLPDNLYIKGNLELRGSQVAELPGFLYVGGNMDIQETRITTLPNGLSVGGNLNLINSGVATFPEIIYIKGGLIVGKNLEDAANKLKENGRVQGEITVI